MVRVKDARQSTDIAAAIDKMFENSSAETRTDQERDDNFMRGSPITLIMRTAMVAGFAIILVGVYLVRGDHVPSKEIELEPD